MRIDSELGYSCIVVTTGDYFFCCRADLDDQMPRVRTPRAARRRRRRLKICTAARYFAHTSGGVVRASVWGACLRGLRASKRVSERADECWRRRASERAGERAAKERRMAATMAAAAVTAVADAKSASSERASERASAQRSSLRVMVCDDDGGGSGGDSGGCVVRIGPADVTLALLSWRRTGSPPNGRPLALSLRRLYAGARTTSPNCSERRRRHRRRRQRGAAMAAAVVSVARAPAAARRCRSSPVARRPASLSGSRRRCRCHGGKFLLVALRALIFCALRLAVWEQKYVCRVVAFSSVSERCFWRSGSCKRVGVHPPLLIFDSSRQLSGARVCTQKIVLAALARSPRAAHAKRSRADSRQRLQHTAGESRDLRGIARATANLNGQRLGA